MKIVMYHYVRPFARSRFPNLKGRTLEEFEFQLNYFKNHFHIVDPQEVIDSASANKAFPKNWILLTFDDGYLDHYRYVFPLLLEHKVKGMFFPPSRMIMQRELLGANKIHLILSSCKENKTLYGVLCEKLAENMSSTQIDHLKQAYFGPSRFDDAETVFIKCVLQKGIPLSMRSIIIDALFSHFVNQEACVIAEEFYMTAKECKVLIQNGMHIGSHGVEHYWMGELSVDEQEQELTGSIQFLQLIYNQTDLHNLTMCYPYGSYNTHTLYLLKKHNFKLGLTTKVGDADLTKGKFELCRYDTNDFPYRS